MIILIGESGSGKTTILNELAKRGFEKASNHTTRKPRKNEQELGEYQFVSKEEFNAMWNKGELLQRAEFNGEYYGISTASLKDNVAFISIVESIQDIKKRMKELGMNHLPLTCFYIQVSAEERTKRMLARGDAMENIQARIQLDKEKFINTTEVVDYVIDNIDLQQTVENIIRTSEIVENKNNED